LIDNVEATPTAAASENRAAPGTPSCRRNARRWRRLTVTRARRGRP